MPSENGKSYSFGFSLKAGESAAADNSFQPRSPTVTSTLSKGFTIETDEFKLGLDFGWIQHESEEPDQFLFASESRGATVVISYVQAQIPQNLLLEAAETTSRARLEAETQADPRAIFGQHWVEMREDNGHPLAHVAYACRNDHSISRYMGWVTEAKFLNLWVCIETLDEDVAKRVFEEVFEGFRFFVP